MSEWDRDSLEGAFARRLGKVGRELFRKVMDALGDNPSIEKISGGLWQEITDGFSAAIRVSLENVAVDYLKNKLDDPASISFDFGQVNTRASQWARQYSSELVTKIDGTTRDMLREKIEGFYTDKRSLQELTDSISDVFGPVRAANIAMTETTRAASQGESIFEDELKAMGLETDSEWQTVNDESVCAICGPLDGTKRSEGLWTVGPPDDSHPGCRCRKVTVIVEKDKA